MRLAPLPTALTSAATLSARAGPALLGIGSSDDGSGTSEAQCTVALVKNIVGTGVLTLPAGVSRLSDNGLTSSEALALGTVLMLIFGALSAWGFVLVGEACVGDRSMERPPQKPNSTEFYDSMVDRLADPKMVILSAGSDNRAYPEFVLRLMA